MRFLAPKNLVTVVMLVGLVVAGAVGLNRWSIAQETAATRGQQDVVDEMARKRLSEIWQTEGEGATWRVTSFDEQR